MERGIEINLKEMLRADSDDHVSTLSVSVDEVRAFIDGTLHDFGELETTLDEAQGVVFSDTATAAYVIIKITK